MVLQLHDVEPTHRIHTSKRNILPSSFLHRRIDIAPRCETIAIQEISKGYQRQKTNLRSPMDESVRMPRQYLVEAEAIT